MASTKLRKKLRWIEGGLYLGGAALIAVFFLIRAEGQNQAEEGIQAFEAEVARHAERQDAQIEQAALADFAAPDTALWDQARIERYEETLEAGGGPPLGVITIDKIGLQVPVFDGADDFNLNRGVARIRGTARADTVGNLGIAGHRDSFFRGLKDIEPGDSIRLQTVRGIENYQVSSVLIVEPSELSVLAPTEEKTLTLVTCYPFYYVGHAPQRFIVKATAEHFLAET
jgi:sortase A